MALITLKPKDVIIPLDILLKLKPKDITVKPQEKEKQNDSSNR